MNDTSSNVARHLRNAALNNPQAIATLSPLSVNEDGRVIHDWCSFLKLDQESDAAARIFHAEGITTGTRTLLAVRAGHDLIVCMFGLLKLGAIPIAIDPGMGWKKMLQCIENTMPTALVAQSKPFYLSYLPFKAFKSITRRVEVNGKTWKKLIKDCSTSTARPLEPVTASSLAAIIFTSGSTGAPKGVRYTHGMFDAQISLVRKTYQIQPGEVDMAMLPVFGLFNPALGVTTVTPLLDPSRPADANPALIVSALLSEKVTSSFGSPAIWGKIARYCEAKKISLPLLKRLLIAGAPVPIPLLKQLKKIAPQCQIHTPYGATECLPVSSIESNEILNDTFSETLRGQGTCVGKPVSTVRVKIINETADVIRNLNEATVCAPNTIGEIIVTGPSVTHAYDHNPEATLRTKINDDSQLWHRMGDLGRLDHEGRLWFHGRCIEKIVTAKNIITTESVEPAFQQHRDVARCALIGIGNAPNQIPVLVVEPKPDCFPESQGEIIKFTESLREITRFHTSASQVKRIVFQEKLPVDVRHNAKIHRLELTREWNQKLRREIKNLL
jgi:acyl-CoA synthetase (AMP-forming)/AMP-acid ligase II